MMRRFSSAAVVRSEAFQSQSATMITNAKTSAVALNAPASGPPCEEDRLSLHVW